MRLVTLTLGLLIGCDATDSGGIAKDGGAETGEAGPSEQDIDRDGYPASNDCQDQAAWIHPGAEERCDGVDEDCDGTVDEEAADAAYWFADGDSDGYGLVDVVLRSCIQPPGYRSSAGDCDDNDPAVRPGARETCDGEDDDCDGTVDEGGPWWTDADGDGFGDETGPVEFCSAEGSAVADATDCDDADDDVFPGNPDATCDSKDNDCNGTVDDGPWWADADSDGYGDASSRQTTCVPTSVRNGWDCDDTDATSWLGGTLYADTDGDGFGDPSVTVTGCSATADYVDNAYDCDDADATEPVVADPISGSAAGLGSMTSPLDSLQDAVDAADACVVAYQGTYAETIDLGGKSLDVWGVDGADYTTIDAGLAVCDALSWRTCQATVSIASGSGARPRLHGFTITGGTGATSSTTTATTCTDSTSSHAGASTCTVTSVTYCGGGISVSGDDPILEDLIVTANELPANDSAATGVFMQVTLASMGGGICITDGTASLDGVWVSDNYADTGGGIYVTGASIVDVAHATIVENDASDGAGVGVAGGTLSLSNSVLACNIATTDGGGIFGESAAIIAAENIVLFGNGSATSGSARGADVWVSSTTGLELTNSIAENDIDANLLYGAGAATLEYDSLENSGGPELGGSFSAGTGSFVSSGNFAAASCAGAMRDNDWALVAGSPAIAAGNPAAAYNDVDGSRNDMGVFGGPGGAGP